jgi:hypothetical protein
MKRYLLIGLMALVLLTASKAGQEVTATLSPVVSKAGIEVDFALTITNGGPNPVSTVKLQVPLEEDVPAYSIKAFEVPEGWTYEMMKDVVTGDIRTFTWKALEGNEIYPNQSKGFDFTAKTPKEEKTYTWGVKVIDTKGIKTVIFLETGVDISPPRLLEARITSATSIEVEFSEPLDEATVEMEDFVIDIEIIDVEVVEELIALTTAEFATNATFTLRLEADALTDLAGNPNEEEEVKTVDKAAPAVIDFSVDPQVFSPNQDGIKDETLITASLSEVVDWNLSIDGVRKFEGKGVALSQVWDGKDEEEEVVEDGVYTLRLSIVDLAGNPAEIEKSIAVDTIAPEKPVEGQIVLEMNPEGVEDIVYGMMGAVEERALVEVYANDELTELITSVEADINGSFEEMSIGDDEYEEIWIVAVDKAGNRGEALKLVNVFKPRVPIIPIGKVILEYSPPIAMLLSSIAIAISIFNFWKLKKRSSY